MAIATTSMYLKVIDHGIACSEYPSDTSISYPFPLDPWQQHACEAINNGFNVFVSAKTGSGKTLPAEHQISKSIANGLRVFYTGPIKGLSNQKYNDLKEAFSHASVGIMTGDIKSEPNADIVVMTTEILRNLLLKQGTDTESFGLTASLSLDRLDAVILDECHYINDYDRGHVWEEIIVNLPKHIKIIMLSATMKDSIGFADWIAKTREHTTIHIATTHRVVPLTHYAAKVVDGHLEMTEICATNTEGKEVYNPVAYKKWSQDKYNDYKKEEEFRKTAATTKATNAAIKAAAAAAGEAPVHALPAAEGKFHLTSYNHQLNVAIEDLQSKDLLPALVFDFSRKNCEKRAAIVEANLLTPGESAEVTHIIASKLRERREALSTVPQYHVIVDLLKKGVAFHHSGLLPILKEIVEILFSKGLVKVLFCTETFAVGINMPTRTVIFTELRKYDSSSLRIVRPDEYIQMAGRAGRRGKDLRGTVIYLPSHKPVSPAEMQLILAGSLPTINSRLKFSYEFILKILHAGTDKYIDVVSKSLWYHQQTNAVQTYVSELAAATKAVQDLRTANNLTDEVITELEQRDALDTKMRAAINAARKEAQRELDRWNNKHMGRTWALAIEAWPKYKDLLLKEARALKVKTEASAHLEDLYSIIAPQIKFLQGLDYIEADGRTLTKKGTMATEINEGHPILLTELYMSGAFKGLTAPEIIAVMSAFNTEKSIDDDKLEPVNDKIQPVIERLSDIRDHLSHGDPNDWRITTEFVNITLDWLNGESAATICENYNIFEGNLTKLVMKLQNLYEELQIMATINNDVDLLNTIKDLNIVNGIAIPDSLYLYNY